MINPRLNGQKEYWQDKSGGGGLRIQGGIARALSVSGIEFRLVVVQMRNMEQYVNYNRCKIAEMQIQKGG